MVAKWRAVGVVRDDVADLGADGLPAAMGPLWSGSDGTAAMDDDEIMFWPRDNILHDPGLAVAGHLVFADHRLGSIAWLYRLADGRVLARRGAIDTHAADSFDDFLACYLAAPRDLIVNGDASG